MGARTGKAFVESLKDGREVWIDGERVRDVTTDRRFRATPLSLGELYDMQHEVEFRDVLTYASPATGARVGLSHIQPKSADDLRRRRAMVKTWMDRCGGMMGRTPDFLNVMVSAFAAGHAYFGTGGELYANNIRAYHELIRENDLALTHSLVTPEIDRSKPIFEQPGDVAMRAVRETDAGIFVRGARSVATLGPFANEILVLPSHVRVPLVSDAESYILGFAVPVATAGVRLICRPSLAKSTGRALDNPLSSRMDEMDAVVWFEDAFVPWERVFLYRNLEAAASIRKVGSGQTMHQSGTKAWAKAEFLLGIALAVAETNKGDTQPQIQALLAEMISTVEMVRGLLVASEAECVPGPSGTVVPNDQPLSVIRLLFPSLHARMVEILQLVCSGNLVLVPSIDELRGGAADAVATYCAGAGGIPADKKIELLRLAWDASCSGFAGRQVLYERFFSGDPWRNALTRTQSYPRAGELKQRIWGFLERSEAWDLELAELWGPA